MGSYQRCNVGEKMSCEEFFQYLWQGYTSLTPQAEKIHKLFIEDGNDIVNDHVAFRTFNLPPISISCLEPGLIALGYQAYQSYTFKEKKLKAWSYNHESMLQPRLFFSELLVEELSSNAQQIIHQLVDDIPLPPKGSAAFHAGRLWPSLSWKNYQSLSQESEYAAWVAVMGLCANHFTISVNELKNDSMDYVLGKLASININMNKQGGVLKGTPDSMLVQCATLADECEVCFSGGEKHRIPSCYYEFAKRYKDVNGQVYQGFVPANANTIFHSTDLQSKK